MPTGVKMESTGEFLQVKDLTPSSALFPVQTQRPLQTSGLCLYAFGYKSQKTPSQLTFLVTYHKESGGRAAQGSLIQLLEHSM